MAWYAELKRRHWYCINEFDAISYYKRLLFDKWYNSLTEEEKDRLQREREEKEKRDRQSTARALNNLLYFNLAVLNHVSK